MSTFKGNAVFEILDNYKEEILRWDSRGISCREISRKLVQQKGILVSGPSIQFWLKINKLGRKYRKKNRLK